MQKRKFDDVTLQYYMGPAPRTLILGDSVAFHDTGVKNWVFFVSILGPVYIGVAFYGTQ